MMSQVNTIRPPETPSIETERGGSSVNKFAPLDVFAASRAASLRTNGTAIV